MSDAQIRIHDWRGPPSSALFNRRWEEAVGNIVLNGLEVVPGSGGMKITVKPGAGIIAGLTFVETQELVDVVEIPPAHPSLPRIDTVVAQYTRQEVIPQPEVIYNVVTGEPAENPQRPALGANQLRLADVYVAPGATLITLADITLPQKFRDRIRDLVDKGALTERSIPLFIEGVIWARPDDPAQAADTDVQVGDLWINTGENPPGIYKWDGEQWLDIQAWENIKNKPSNFPPEPHALDGELHTGNLPISRVSGHTAFGPPAHQEAFAASCLRRPH